MSNTEKFTPVPFKRTKKFGDYMLRKLKDNYVILTVTVRKGTLICVDSRWECRDEIRFYTINPVMSGTDEESYIDIASECEDEATEEGILGYNKTDVEMWIKRMDPNCDYQEYWFLSNDIGNAWGPLECDLAEYFLKQHPQISIVHEKDLW